MKLISLCVWSFFLDTGFRTSFILLDVVPGTGTAQLTILFSPLTRYFLGLGSCSGNRCILLVFVSKPSILCSLSHSSSSSDSTFLFPSFSAFGGISCADMVGFLCQDSNGSVRPPLLPRVPSLWILRLWAAVVLPLHRWAPFL